MPCNSIPFLQLRWFSNALRLAILTESRRLEMRLLCCGWLTAWLVVLCLWQEVLSAASAAFLDYRPFFKCAEKLIKTPSVSVCFGLCWTVEPYLFLDFGRESSTIQYVNSDLNSNSLPLELETQGRMLVLMTARVRNSVESDPSFAKHFPMPSSVKQVTEIYWKFMWNVDALLDG